MCVDALFLILVIHSACSGDQVPQYRRRHALTERNRGSNYEELPLTPFVRVKDCQPHEEEKHELLSEKLEESKAGGSLRVRSERPGLLHEEESPPAGSASKSVRVQWEEENRCKK